MNSSRIKKLLKPQVYFIFYLEVAIRKNIILLIKGLTHLLKKKKRVSGAGVVIQYENICLTNLNLSSGPSTKRKEKERKGKKKKVS